ncbi:MAG: inosine-5-monophosphate dehydrogenase [Betaproteobacteria bacterium RBG_16_64_9]|nr:MAG: inosine-5-monophosphate dehydrogenase [Betaproteobacteria bacterium RBG_16_64_9]OGA19205.1 MAG: inosine-5-monophosphate dehydrogenase [Betaproteobacteria bacterium RIFCSPLOWO2_02_FULL_65_24]OGA87358.1 MAG: inosine-5-monophosphate dehydrogenase [Betaproteobacteria bacterium RIFCSPLOWO2_12_FULL_66_14]
MTIVAHLLKSKPDQAVHTASPDMSVQEAMTRMADKNVGALVVLDGDSIAGIVSERDYARKVPFKGRSAKDTLVRDIMTSRVLYVRPGQTSEECMALMTGHRLRHLPVLDKGKLVGVISIGDLVKDIIAEQQFIIEQLEHYIMGDLVAKSH